MRAIVVYESVWGNTAAVARAIAEGFGPDATAYPTDGVPADRLASADLIVAGSPVFAFSLPSEAMREHILASETEGPAPDLSHPSLRSWLETLPAGHGLGAAFDTRIWWSPRGATGTIEKRLAERGYRRLAKAEKFVVRDKYGPLRDGELESSPQVGFGPSGRARGQGPRDPDDDGGLTAWEGIGRPAPRSAPDDRRSTTMTTLAVGRARALDRHAGTAVASEGGRARVPLGRDVPRRDDARRVDRPGLRLPRRRHQRSGCDRQHRAPLQWRVDRDGARVLAAGILFFRVHRRPGILATFIIGGVGVIGAGLFPLDTGAAHSLFALSASSGSTSRRA